MENIEFLTKKMETKAFVLFERAWSREFKNELLFVSIPSYDGKSAAQGAKKGRFCMGILVTLSLSKKKAPIGRKKYFC